jgi:hypothetical protein
MLHAFDGHRLLVLLLLLLLLLRRRIFWPRCSLTQLPLLLCR